MPRTRQNGKYGTITNDPLGVADTTLSSATLTSVSTLTSGEQLITLDPEQTYGAPEYVKITDHVSASTNATITRAQLGSTARSHPVGTRWIHGAYDTDYTIQCTSSTRPTVGLTEGVTIIETDTDRVLRYDGSGWVRTGWYSSTGRTGFKLANGTGVSLTSGAAADMTWVTETSDVDGFITATSATITVPSGMGGLYYITFEGTFSANPGTTPLVGYARNGASPTYAPCPPSATSLLFYTTVLLDLSAGHTFKWRAYQASGSTVTLTGNCEGYRIGA